VKDNVEIQLPQRPRAGLIIRGVWAREYRPERVEWFCRRSDLITAHKWHITRARQYREGGYRDAALMHLNGAAIIRGYLSKPLPVRSTLPLLRIR